MGNGQKNFSASQRFFLVVLSHWQRFFEVWQRKNCSACENFFLTHLDILLWPHSIWLRVRVAQCAMALRVMVKSHLRWPWECQRSPDTSFGTILDEYALQDGWHPSCYRLLRHTFLRMTGHHPHVLTNALPSVPSHSFMLQVMGTSLTRSP